MLELLRPPATVAEVLPDVDGALDLLDRLGDPARTVHPAVLRTVYARLAAALDGVDVAPPERVRVAPDRVVADAVVLDAPWLQPLVDRPSSRPAGRPARSPTCSTCRWRASWCGRRSTSRAGRVGSVGASCPARGWPPPGSGRRELAGEVAVHAALVVGGRAVAWWPGGGRRPRRRQPGGAGPGAGLAGRGLVRSPGPGRGVRRTPTAPSELAAEDAVGE